MDLREVLEGPMVDWEKLVDEMSESERMDLSDAAASLATLAARLSAYVSRRHTGGQHADAVKSQNRAARGVRQALGYTYADDRITF